MLFRFAELVDIYKINLNYITEYRAINTDILLALIRDKCMNVERTLRLIPYIHSGYLDIILEGENDG